MRQREIVILLAQGRVLEVGIGSGLKLPFYDPAKVSRLWGLGPSVDTWNIRDKRHGTLGFDVECIEGSAEEISLEVGSIDCVIVTYSFCTTPDVIGSLVDIRRVLRPGGELLFWEHGVAPAESTRKWQDRLSPLWKRIGGGCYLNRPIALLLEQGGFQIRNMEIMYLPGWKPVCFNYWGTAVFT